MQRRFVLEGKAASPDLRSAALVMGHFPHTFSPWRMVIDAEGVVQIYPLNEIWVQVMSLAIFLRQVTLGKLSLQASFYFISHETHHLPALQPG